MKKCILLLLLAVHLNAFGQILSKIRPVNLTAQQDSIVRGFASQYRPIYTVDGHFMAILSWMLLLHLQRLLSCCKITVFQLSHMILYSLVNVASWC